MLMADLFYILQVLLFIHNFYFFKLSTLLFMLVCVCVCLTVS